MLGLCGKKDLTEQQNSNGLINSNSYNKLFELYKHTITTYYLSITQKHQ